MGLDHLSTFIQYNLNNTNINLNTLIKNNLNNTNTSSTHSPKTTSTIPIQPQHIHTTQPQQYQYQPQHIHTIQPQQYQFNLQAHSSAYITSFTTLFSVRFVNNSLYFVFVQVWFFRFHTVTFHCYCPIECVDCENRLTL